MIQFLINDSAVRQTLPVICNMLANRDDDLLLIAQGYIKSHAITGLDLEAWLRGRTDRRIVMLVGIHGQGELTFKDSNAGDVVEDVIAVLKNWKLPKDSADRVLLYAVEHFHAKFFATCKSEKDRNWAETFSVDANRALTFRPTEVVLGSSNLTSAALQGPNIEFDVHIPRGSEAELGEFASKFHTILSRAISTANDSDTFSYACTVELRSHLKRRLHDLCAYEMEECSRQLERDLMDPDI